MVCAFTASGLGSVPGEETKICKLCCVAKKNRAIDKTISIGPLARERSCLPSKSYTFREFETWLIQHKCMYKTYVTLQGDGI